MKISSSILLLMKALTTSYCLISKSKTAEMTTRALNVLATRVAAYVSRSVICKSSRAHSRALNLVRKSLILYLYLNTHVKGIVG